MEEKNKIWSLLARKLSGEISDAEEKELEDLLSQHPDDAEAIIQLKDWWKAEEKPKQSGQYDKLAENSFRHIEETFFEETENNSENQDEMEDHPHTVSFSLSYFLKWAAVLAFMLLIGGGIYLYSHSNQKDLVSNATHSQSHQSEISTRYGSKSRVTLPDGTVVWLNAGSKLRYDNQTFGSKNRKVVLIGEGFFDVAENADLPFILQAGKVQVTVLGTTFDMKSYPEDKTIEATLVSGSIKIGFVDNMKKGIVLKPHQKVTIFKEDELISTNLKVLKPAKKEKVDKYNLSSITYVPSDSTIVETSWVQNKLAFRSESFKDLATQLERWYDVKINFGSSKIKHYQFTGVFMDESLEQVLKALQITAPFHYRIEKDKEVYITQ